MPQTMLHMALFPVFIFQLRDFALSVFVFFAIQSALFFDGSKRITSLKETGAFAYD